MQLNQLRRQKSTNVLHYLKDMPIKPFHLEEVHKLSYESVRIYLYTGVVDFAMC